MKIFVLDFEPELEAEKEFALDINDNGDVVGLSDGRLFVGNPGLAIEFTEVVALSGLQINPDGVQITNPMGPIPAILSGVVDGGDGDQLFRMFIDGSGFELAPNNTDADGIGSELFHTNGDHDVNDLGDVTAVAFAYTPKGKKNRNSSWYAALWPFNSNEIVPVGDTD